LDKIMRLHGANHGDRERLRVHTRDGALARRIPPRDDRLPQRQA
jgi:hypothetical protein